MGHGATGISPDKRRTDVCCSRGHPRAAARTTISSPRRKTNSFTTVRMLAVHAGRNAFVMSAARRRLVLARNFFLSRLLQSGGCKARCSAAQLHNPAVFCLRRVGSGRRSSRWTTTRTTGAVRACTKVIPSVMSQRPDLYTWNDMNESTARDAVRGREAMESRSWCQGRASLMAQRLQCHGLGTVSAAL